MQHAAQSQKERSRNFGSMLQPPHLLRKLTMYQDFVFFGVQGVRVSPVPSLILAPSLDRKLLGLG